MTTAYVLSGGASLGAVQVGMLAALDEQGVRPDLVVGSSVGALNGAWIAGRPAGAGVGELGRVWRSLTRNTVFPLHPLRGLFGFLGARDHLVPNRGIRRLLSEHLQFRLLEQARVPLHIVATDVLTGQDVRLSRGDAVEAILASSAVPGVLPPVRINARSLMDGGVNNTPISHAVDLGADVIWVLASGIPCARARPPSSALGMALHAVTLLIHQRLAADVARYESVVELRVVPPLCPAPVSLSDFSRAGELIDRAYQTTRDWLAAGRPGAGRSQAVLLRLPDHHSDVVPASEQLPAPG
ncbi:MAG: patatin-like phospholipase family protein [Actinobacteria bacterium]|nr:patatin-like phospholipase family protein [Actinomycetota bacterium]